MLRTLFHTALCAALTFAISLAPAQAQAPPSRDGLHLSVGVGGASVSASCSVCEGVDFFDDRISGFSGVAQLGGALTSRLVLATEFSGWIQNDETLDRRIATLSIAVIGYPSETGGLFVKSAIGGLRAVVENEAAWVQTDAFVSQLGVGYDVPVGGAELTPYINYIWTYGGETYFNGYVSPEAVYPNAIQAGVAVTLH